MLYEDLPRLISERIDALIKRSAGGNVSAFVRMCEKVGGDLAPTHSTIRKYLAGGIPGLDKAAVMAAAAGVPLTWFIESEEHFEVDREKPKPDVDPELIRRSLGQSVESTTQPERVMESPLFSIESMGRSMLEISFVTRGTDDPIRIPINIRGINADIDADADKQ